jgi:hypothetical protein
MASWRSTSERHASLEATAHELGEEAFKLQQPYDAVSFVVVGHRAGAARLHWQPGCCRAPESGSFHRPRGRPHGGRIHIQADEFLGKLRVIRQLAEPPAHLIEFLDRYDQLYYERQLALPQHLL